MKFWRSYGIKIVVFINGGAGAKIIFRKQVLVQNLSSSHLLIIIFFQMRKKVFGIQLSC